MTSGCVHNLRSLALTVSELSRILLSGYYSGVELRFAHELLNITGKSGTLIKISIDDLIQ